VRQGEYTLYQFIFFFLAHSAETGKIVIVHNEQMILPRENAEKSGERRQNPHGPPTNRHEPALPRSIAKGFFCRTGRDTAESRRTLMVNRGIALLCRLAWDKADANTRAVSVGIRRARGTINHNTERYARKRAAL